jgi:hypothetical protein
MSIDYTQEKLWAAMETLIGPGTLVERVRKVVPGFISARVHGAFPTDPALDERFDQLVERARNIADDSAAYEVAKEIFAFYVTATNEAPHPVKPDARLIELKERGV